jgi:hypothetical protein
MTKTQPLSDLQRAILRLAIANHNTPIRARDDSGGTDVTYAEVLISHYNFPRTCSCPRDDIREYGGQKFSMKQIGEKRYRAAMAAVSRAFLRLESRGLIERNRGAFRLWSGGVITEAGKIAANTLGNLPQVLTTVGAE